MRALLLSEYKKLQIADVPVPVPSPGEILVHVAACGICGSDVHGYDGSSGRRIPPIVMGHEAAGVVVSVGAGVAGFHEGDRVTFDSTVYCGECVYCRAGAFAEFVSVPARIVYKLPDSLSFAEAALLEAVSVALHAASLVEIEPHSTGLVVGAGMIGLLVQQALHIAGCSRVFVSDIDTSRLELSKSMGATEVLHSGPDFRDKLMHLTDGIGVDVAVEAVGNDDAVQSAIHSVRKGGSVVLVGNISAEVTIPLQKVVTRQITLQGSCASAGEYPRAIELMRAAEINVKPLSSAVAPLDEGPQWFDRLYHHERGLLKIVLEPGGSA